jgi:flagellar hook-basal body complex protein FliE
MSASSLLSVAASPSPGAGSLTLDSSSRSSPLEGFHRLLDDFLTRMNQDQMKVDEAVKDLALGRASDLHTIALATAKADVHFRLAMEIRTKVLDAFQEVMRMQV